MGSPSVMKYSLQISFDKDYDNYSSDNFNLSGYDVVGTYKTHCNTFMNTSSFGLPFGNYKNSAIGMGSLAGTIRNSSFSIVKNESDENVEACSEFIFECVNQ